MAEDDVAGKEGAEHAGGDLAGVGAGKLGVQFCAPSFTGEPSSTRATLSRAVKGGHTTTSTPWSLPTAVTMFSTRSTASPEVLFIFQLPAMSFLRSIMGGVEGVEEVMLGSLLVGPGRDRAAQLRIKFYLFLAAGKPASAA